MNINIYNIVKTTKVLGPGIRYAIWFQGCKRNCKGCLAPDSRRFDKKNPVEITTIITDIKNTPEIVGVTISGGEPFEQKDSLFKLLVEIKKLNLNTIVYTGYSLEDLAKKEENIKILQLIDLVIDGEYIEELDNNQPLRGSENQSLYYFSPVGEEMAKSIESLKEREIEIEISNENIFFTGIPNDKHKKSFSII
ncbi:MAG: 4Fe-4S single cluster domain-containing protein [Cetobacterium sp.]|uniref:4Fe-4S single cluster domain-containing protein n=1 Tax=Cetobacterium sp. TaxID=2071632 RepID=UPI003F39467B